MSLNRVILAGIVEEEPSFVFDEVYDGALEVRLKICRSDVPRTDHVSVLIFYEELINRALSEIHIGKFMMVTNGRIVTNNYTRTKTLMCPHCQNIEYQKSSAERTDVECLAYTITEVSDPEAELGLNKVFLEGNICSEIVQNVNPTSHKVYTKYKLAVNWANRGKRHKREGQEEQKNADYPFITSFGAEADRAHTMLNTTALVLVEGAVQERIIRQTPTIICPQCQNIVTESIESPVREIVTSKVYYLNFGQKDSPRQIDEEENEDSIEHLFPFSDGETSASGTDGQVPEEGKQSPADTVYRPWE